MFALQNYILVLLTSSEVTAFVIIILYLHIFVCFHSGTVVWTDP